MPSVGTDEGRPLGAAELHFWRVAKLNHCHFVGMGHFVGEVDPEEIVARVRRQVHRRPSLRWTVQEHPTGPRFVALDPAAFQVQIVEGPHEAWEDRVRGEFRRGFEAGGFLFRATLLVSPGRRVLLVTFHHSIADGLSAVGLIKAIAEDAVGPKEGGAFPASPPIDAFLRTRWRSKVRTLALGIRDYGFFSPEEPPADGWVPLSKRTGDVWFFRLPARQSRAFAAWAQGEGVTVHGALCAVMLKETLARWEDDPARVHRLGCCSPMSLRRHLPTEFQEAVGCYISAFTSFHRLSGQTPLGALAREARASLVGAMQHQHPENFVLLAKAVSPRWDAPPPPEDQFFRFNREATSVTNKGKVHVHCTLPNARLERVHELSCAALLGRSTLSLSVTTFEDQMELSFVYVPGMVERENARNFAQRVVARVMDPTG